MSQNNYFQMNHIKDLSLHSQIISIYDKVVENPVAPSRSDMDDRMMGHRGMHHKMGMGMGMRMGMGMGMDEDQDDMHRGRSHGYGPEFSVTFNSVCSGFAKAQIKQLEKLVKQIAKTRQNINKLTNKDSVSSAAIKFQEEKAFKLLQNLGNSVSKRDEFRDYLYQIAAKVKKYEKIKRKYSVSLKERTSEQMAAAIQMISYLFTKPTTDLVIKPNRQLHSKIEDIIQKAIKKQSYKRVKVNEFEYSQNSYYHQKIAVCVGQMGLQYNTDDDISESIRFSTMFSQQIGKSTLCTLFEDKWLDNRVTSNFIGYLLQIQGLNKKQTYILNHSQSNQLKSGNLDRNLKLSDYKRVALLINADNTHWYVIGIFNTSNTIYVYDSMYSSSREYKKYYDAYMTRIRLQKKDDRIDFRFFQLDDNTASQRNSSDCGVCSIINILYIFDDHFFNSNLKKVNYDRDTPIHIRSSLFKLLAYFGWCSKNRRIIRKDYFNFLIRNQIYNQIRSYHLQKKIQDRKPNK